MNDIIVYDVETKFPVEEVVGGWNNPFDMKISSIVAYSYGLNKYHFFLHNESRIDFVRFLDKRKTVSFNGVSFDSKVLLGNDREVKICEKNHITEISHGEFSWIEYDILLQCVRCKFKFKDVLEAEKKLGQKEIHSFLSLDYIAKNTLGSRYQKSGRGECAPLLYREGQFDKLLEYNLQDVRLTRFLYEFIVKNKYVIDGKGNRIDLRY